MALTDNKAELPPACRTTQAANNAASSYVFALGNQSHQVCKVQHVREREFPADRRLHKKTPESDRVAFQAKCNELRLRAAEQEMLNPVSFAIGNSWTDTLQADKQHYLEYTTRGIT